MAAGPASQAPEEELDFYYAVEMTLLYGRRHGHRAMVAFADEIVHKSTIVMPEGVRWAGPGIVDMILDYVILLASDPDVRRAVQENKAPIMFRDAKFIMRLYPEKERKAHKARWAQRMGAVPASVPAPYRDLWWADHTRVRYELQLGAPMEGEAEGDWRSEVEGESVDDDDVEAYKSFHTEELAWHLRPERQPRVLSPSPTPQPASQPEGVGYQGTADTTQVLGQPRSPQKRARALPLARPVLAPRARSETPPEGRPPSPDVLRPFSMFRV